MGKDKLIDVDHTSERLGGVSTRSLLDARYRARLGLRAIRVGRRLMFSEQEIDRLIERGRERA